MGMWLKVWMACLARTSPKTARYNNNEFRIMQLPGGPPRKTMQNKLQVCYMKF
jgi:hypothetical protein